MKEGAGGLLVPDYASFCPTWWRSCFQCPDFLRDRLRFCRRWNRAVYGVDVANVVTTAESGDGVSFIQPQPALPEPDTGRSWWTYGRGVHGQRQRR